MNDVFVPGVSCWRAMGDLPASGLDIRPRYERFDAQRRFGITLGPDHDPPGCRCGQVIRGRIPPIECPLFGQGCTPLAPVGPCMVSSEGTCAAWYKYADIETADTARRPQSGTHRADTLPA